MLKTESLSDLASEDISRNDMYQQIFGNRFAERSIRQINSPSARAPKRGIASSSYNDIISGKAGSDAAPSCNYV